MSKNRIKFVGPAIKSRAEMEALARRIAENKIEQQSLTAAMDAAITAARETFEGRLGCLVLEAWDKLASATPVTVVVPAWDILQVPLPTIPSGKRHPMDTPAKYVAQFILSMLKLNGGSMDARRMAEAFSLISSRRLCDDLAKIELGTLGRNWIRTFNETTSPELFREILCELYDKEIIDLADRDNKPMVWIKISDPVPKNEWVELDVVLSARLLDRAQRLIRKERVKG